VCVCARARAHTSKREREKGRDPEKQRQTDRQSARAHVGMRLRLQMGSTFMCPSVCSFYVGVSVFWYWFVNGEASPLSLGPRVVQKVVVCHVTCLISYVTCLIYIRHEKVVVCHLPHSYVTCLIDTRHASLICDMPHMNESCHFIWMSHVTAYEWVMSLHMNESCHISIDMWYASLICDMPALCVTCLIYVWPYPLAHASLKRRLTCNADSACAHSYVSHDAFISATWRIHMSDMTHSYVWHDAFICLTWRIHMSDMTH